MIKTITMDQLQNKWEELKKLYNEHQNRTINFKLYNLIYEIDNITNKDNSIDVFYSFCDYYYEMFKEDTSELKIKLEQLGRTSSNYVRCTYNSNDYEHYFNKNYDLIDYMEDIFYCDNENIKEYYNDFMEELEEIEAAQNEVKKYFEIYDHYINNQVENFKAWYEEECDYMEEVKQEELEEIELIDLIDNYVIHNKNNYIDVDQFKNTLIKKFIGE